MVEEEEGIRRFPAIEMQVVMALGYFDGTHSCHGVDLQQTQRFHLLGQPKPEATD